MQKTNWYESGLFHINHNLQMKILTNTIGRNWWIILYKEWYERIMLLDAKSRKRTKEFRKALLREGNGCDEHRMKKNKGWRTG